MTVIELSQVLGNFGEFFGAIAVVLTLGYLVVQIRQNTRMLSSNIYSSWVNTASKSMSMRAEHAESFGAIYTQPSRSWRDLNPTERQLHTAYFIHNLNLYEASYQNYLDGTIGEAIFDAKRRNLILFFEDVLHVETWKALAHRLFDARFVAYVDKHVLPEAESANSRAFRHFARNGRSYRSTAALTHAASTCTMASTGP